MDIKTQKELQSIVKKNYEDIAEQFSETRKKYLWPELIKLAKPVKNGDRVLDVGCGSGRLSEAFLAKEVDYLGIDACSRLVSIAKKEKPDFRFLAGNILELGKVKEIDFDYVFCIAVLQHIPGRKLQINALKQIRNKIKPDGKIVAAVWNMWSNSKVNQHHRFRGLIFKFALLKIIKKNKMDWGDVIFDWQSSEGKYLSKRYYHAFTKRQLKRIARKANLRVERAYKDKYNYYLILSKGL